MVRDAAGCDDLLQNRCRVVVEVPDRLLRHATDCPVYRFGLLLNELINTIAQQSRAADLRCGNGCGGRYGALRVLVSAQADEGTSPKFGITKPSGIWIVVMVFSVQTQPTGFFRPESQAIFLAGLPGNSR